MNVDPAYDERRIVYVTFVNQSAVPVQEKPMLKTLAICYALMTLLFGIAFFSSIAMATEVYPCKPDIDPTPPGFGIQELDPSYPVEYRLQGGQIFRIPYGYGFRARAEDVNCHPETSRFRFSFWMPDLRSPQKDPLGLAESRPREDNQAVPGQNQYIVLVRFVERATDADYADSKLPSRWFRNWIDLFEQRYVLRPAHDGLLQIIETGRSSLFDPPVVSTQYINFEDDKEEIFVDCEVGGSCRLNIYYSDLQLILRAEIPGDAFPQWRAVKDGARTLLERWMVK